MMNMLQGIIQVTYEAFEKITSKCLKLAFVRTDKNKERGCIFFGEKMYGIADIYSSDESVKVEFDGKCGVDLTTEKASSGIKWNYL